MTRTCMIMLHQGKEQPTEIFIFTICSVLKNIFTCEKQTLPWQLVLFLPVQVIHWINYSKLSTNMAENDQELSLATSKPL